MEGISNKTIVNFFENETDNDLKKNFVNVFSSNYVTRFISFHKMIIKKNCYPFIIAIKTVRTGGVFSIYIREKKFFYLTVLGLKDLKNL